MTWHDLHIAIPPGTTGEVDVSCPSCTPTRKNKRAKALSVNVEKETFLCHHCGWAGSLQAGGSADRTQSMPVLYEVPTYHGCDVRDADATYTAFFLDRGISLDTVERHGVQLVRLYMPQVEGQCLVLAFPYFVHGVLRNAKFRTVTEGKHFRMWPRAKRVVYGHDDIVNSADIVFVEGEMDKLALSEVGIQCVVSVPDGGLNPGAKNTQAKMSWLDDIAELCERATRIVLALDNDPVGHALETELIRRFSSEKCLRSVWPANCKDANDVLMQYGKEALRACIVNSTPVPIIGVVTPMDVKADVMALRKAGLQPGVSTGWRTVDQHYTVKPGQVTIITGIPSHGKSSWRDALMVNVARQHNWRFAVFSPEQFPLSRHIATILELYTDKAFQGKYACDCITEDEVEQLVGWVDEHFSFIGEEDGNATLERLLQQAKALVATKGIRGLVLDPWNHIEHLRPRGQSETEYVSQALSAIGNFARKFQVHVLLVAHPQKMEKGKDGKYPVPSPYDISGSAHWYNKCDNCLTVFRDPNPQNNTENLVSLHVQKIKWREVGKPGVVGLRYIQRSGNFSENLNEEEF